MAKKKKSTSGSNSRTRSTTTPEDFVKAWLNGKSIQEVADNLRVSTNAVTARAAAMRKKGVDLPRKGGARYSYDVDALNELIGSHEEED